MSIQFITSSKKPYQHHHGFDLIRILKNYFNAPDVLITGRGASAIYATLKAIGGVTSDSNRHDYIAVPSHICASVPSAIIHAGYKPWFVDINKHDFNLDVQKIYSIPTNTAAIIAPHIYGHPLEIEKLADFCADKNIVLIEDIAQATGAKVRDRLLGTFGDIAIMSFHPSKLIDGTGGGAVIVNNPNLSFLDELKTEISKLPMPPADYSMRSQEIANRINPLLNVTRDATRGTLCEDTSRDNREIEQIYLSNLDLIPFASNPHDECANIDAFSSLEETINKRAERSMKYRSAIKNKLIRHPELSRGTSLFRYSILVDGDNAPELRKRITDHLRANNIHASNLYYPAHLIFSTDTLIKPTTAEYVASRIINLWLDDSVDDGYISKTARLINEI